MNRKNRIIGFGAVAELDHDPRPTLWISNDLGHRGGPSREATVHRVVAWLTEEYKGLNGGEIRYDARAGLVWIDCDEPAQRQAAMGLLTRAAAGVNATEKKRQAAHIAWEKKHMHGGKKDEGDPA